MDVDFAIKILIFFLGKQTTKLLLVTNFNHDFKLKFDYKKNLLE